MSAVNQAAEWCYERRACERCGKRTSHRQANVHGPRPAQSLLGWRCMECDPEQLALKAAREAEAAAERAEYAKATVAAVMGAEQPEALASRLLTAGLVAMQEVCDTVSELALSSFVESHPLETITVHGWPANGSLSGGAAPDALLTPPAWSADPSIPEFVADSPLDTLDDTEWPTPTGRYVSCANCAVLARQLAEALQAIRSLEAVR